MKKQNSSYNQILKSTTIFGGSQVFVILLGLIRTKVIAILLGPFGVGLISIYQSVIDMMRTAFTAGLDTAGVKEIASANNLQNKDNLDRIISGFNKCFKTFAVLALLVSVSLCYPISIWAFGNGDNALYIVLLSTGIVFLILATGKSTVLQGLRRIPEIAKAAIIASILSLIVTIPIYYIWRIDGIIPSLIANNAIYLICIEYYYRKQKIKNKKISYSEAFLSRVDTLRLGIYIVTAGFIGVLSMFIIRSFLAKTVDIDTAGLFQSTWVITNVYLGLILKSMGSDFYPRLSAIAEEKDKVKSLVNEQSYIVLVIASPIIIGMLLFSGLVLSILYSSEFVAAQSLLRWMILGTFIKVLCWPVSFILLAKNKGLLFLLTEAIFYLVFLLSSYFLYPEYGLDAIGIGYLIAYIIYLPVIYFMGYKLSEFRWKGEIIIMALANGLLIGLAFFLVHTNKEGSLLWSLLILSASLIYAFFKLRKVFRLEDMKNWFRKK